MGALSLVAEVGDGRRFAHAGAFTALTGLVPCERSSGDSVWRGHITRTDSKHLRFQLVESAWSYHHRPLIAGPVLIEAYDEWQVAERRYLSEGSMAKLAPTGDDGRRPKEVKRATAELVAS